MFNSPRAPFGGCPKTAFTSWGWSGHQDDLLVSNLDVPDLSTRLRLDIYALLHLFIGDPWRSRISRGAQRG